VVEDHRQHRDGLADRLLLQARRVQLGDESSDPRCVDPVDRFIAEAR
jgi:hypothetical protein